MNFISATSFFVIMAELALKRKKKKIKAYFKLQVCIGGWFFWVWVGGGWMRKREKQRDGE